jgi:hypothetical protein
MWFMFCIILKYLIRLRNAEVNRIYLKRHRYFPCHLRNFIVANDIDIRSTVPLHVIAQADTPKTEKIIKNRFDDDIL